MENQGPDIPPEKLDRIFEQFFRLDASRCSASGGAGLGLAIAKEIVERHNGTIRAESKAHRLVFCHPARRPGGMRELPFFPRILMDKMDKTLPNV